MLDADTGRRPNTLLVLLEPDPESEASDLSRSLLVAEPWRDLGGEVLYLSGALSPAERRLPRELGFIADVAGEKSASKEMSIWLRATPKPSGRFSKPKPPLNRG